MDNPQGDCLQEESKLNHSMIIS